MEIIDLMESESLLKVTELLSVQPLHTHEANNNRKFHNS